jgi:hypothetical protein
MKLLRKCDVVMLLNKETHHRFELDVERISSCTHPVDRGCRDVASLNYPSLEKLDDAP